MSLFPAGHILTSADLDTLFPVGVGAWTSYTPTLTQSVTVTKTVNYARYMKVGRMVTCAVNLGVTGAGTAANAVVLGLPLTSAVASATPCGTGFIFDSSTGLAYPALVLLDSTTAVQFLSTQSTGVARLGAGGSWALALANADSVNAVFTYESAT